MVFLVLGELKQLLREIYCKPNISFPPAKAEMNYNHTNYSVTLFRFYPS